MCIRDSRGIAKKDVERGQVLAAPKSIHPHTKFKGQVYVCLLYTSNPSRPKYLRSAETLSKTLASLMCRPGLRLDKPAGVF